MKVYIITTGEYSDYHIVGVCGSEEQAKRVAKHINRGCNIEPYEVDKISSFVDRGLHEWSVYFNEPSGDVGNMCMTDDWYGNEPRMKVQYVDYSKTPQRPSYFRVRNNVIGMVNVKHILSTTREGAIKIASEARTRLLARRVNEPQFGEYGDYEV